MAGVHVLGMLHVLAFNTAYQTIIIRCILSMCYCMSCVKRLGRRPSVTSASSSTWVYGVQSDLKMTVIFG
jgi:Ni,Fe-hydrogenase I cytochrome b subunit